MVTAPEPPTRPPINREADHGTLFRLDPLESDRAVAEPLGAARLFVAECDALPLRREGDVKGTRQLEDLLHWLHFQSSHVGCGYEFSLCALPGQDR